LATEALRMALAQRRPGTGLVQHTDRGSQYTSVTYGLTLAAHHVAQSVGKPGTAYDNAVAESFFATLKLELIYRNTWPTRRQVTSAIFEFIEGWYNRQRRHSTLGYLTPDAFEAHHRSATLAA
jgi:putative transposase